MTAPRLRNPTAFPRGQALASVYAELKRYPNVVGCFVGRRRRGGKLTTSKAIIVCVSEKVARGKVPAKSRLPRRIDWSDGHASGTVAIDVQVLGDSGRHSHAEPGDTLTTEQVTLGVALEHPAHGPVITTAAHGFLSGPGEVSHPQGGPLVSILRRDGSQPSVISARLLYAILTDRMDYALLRSDTAISNTYGDLMLGGLYVTADVDIGRQFYALRKEGPRVAVLRGTAVDVPIDGQIQDDMIITTFVTEDGDSGCPLVHRDLRFVALLKGWAYLDEVRHSIWMPVIRPLIREQATIL
jgi:hypothetical protein